MKNQVAIFNSIYGFVLNNKVTPYKLIEYVALSSHTYRKHMYLLFIYIYVYRHAHMLRGSM